MSAEALQALVIVGISIVFLVVHLWPRLTALVNRLRRSRSLLDAVPYERLAVEIFEFLEQRRLQDLDRDVHPLAGVPANASDDFKEGLLAAHRKRVAAYSSETVDLFNRRFGLRAEYLFGLARAAGYLHERDDGVQPSRPTNPADIAEVAQTLKLIAQMIDRAPALVSQKAD